MTKHADGPPRDTLAVVRPQDVSPAWLTEALRQRGLDAQVESFKIETVGTGQLGETRRFHLQYAGAAPADAPASVVGKFTSDNAVAAASGRDMGFYRSEVMFYRELAHRAEINTPFVYAAEIEPESGEFSLLFEDLAPAVQGDHMQGCNVESARAALGEAALLHAAFWNDRDLMNQDWVYVPEGAQGFYTTELMESSWQHFEKNYAPHMDPEVIRVCDRFIRHHAEWNAPRDFPKCFSHNDFRVDNMLFGPERIAVVDWQTSNFLGAGMDVAYFLGSAFDRDTRREVEMDLLRGYHEELLRHGVSGYGFDQLRKHYRHYAFAVLAVAIAATVIVKQTPRGDQLFMKMVTDGAHQILDNDALDLLGS